MKILVLLLLCAVSPLSASSRSMSEREKQATGPADLGPETIDVFDYPEIHKMNYPLFLYKCSRCHTPARAINSPLTTEKEWKKYIGIMHTLSRKGWLWPEDRQWIREFLVYDSKVRKIDNRETFLKQQQELGKRYKHVLYEREWTPEEERHENP